MARTKNQIQEEVNLLKKKIASGRLKGEAKRKAVRRKCNLEFALRNFDKRKASKKRAVDKDQGFLPSFLGQMNMVRVEELVADKIFGQIKKEIEETTVQKTRKEA